MVRKKRVGLTALAVALVEFALSCEDVRDTAGLVVELERRYPGSRVEIDDERGRGRKIEVMIEASSFDVTEEADLAEQARGVARDVAQRYELRSERDTVAVEFRSERRTGPFASRQNIRFAYPVAELDTGE